MVIRLVRIGYSHKLHFISHIHFGYLIASLIVICLLD